jgi:hypothetical protein
MKKYLLIAIFVGIVAGVQAQGVEFFSETVTLQGPNTDEFKANTGIKNNSTDSADTKFTWRFMNYGLPSGWNINLCDPFECINNVSASTTHSFTLPLGQSGIFYADFGPNGNNGTANMTVIVTSNKNPNNADTVVMAVTAWITGIKEAYKTKSVSFFPNPVKEQLTLKFPTKQALNVDIYNILGVKVKTFVHEGASTQIVINDLQDGVYFIRFTENGKLYTKQFVKAQ